MGLEENADTGLNIEDIVSIFKGHMKDRYQVFKYMDALVLPSAIYLLGCGVLNNTKQIIIISCSSL